METRSWKLEARKSSKHPAFTLIELAFVTAVLALLLFAALPRFQQTAGRLRIEQAATHLTQTLRYARQQAVSEGRTLLWVWDAEDQQSQLMAVDERGEAQPLTNREAFFATLPQGVSLAVEQEGQAIDRISFFADGSSDAATLAVKQGEKTLYTVTLHGQIGQPCLAAGTAAC